MTPVSTPRRLGGHSPTTNIDDLIPSVNLNDDSADVNVVISAQFGHFTSSLADRDEYRKKVPLKEGFSHRDWTEKCKNMPKPDELPIITPDQLKEHNNGGKGLWIAVNGNVYDITAYLT